jgi:uncharacterized repeat protein (TIGR03803 family)
MQTSHRPLLRMEIPAPTSPRFPMTKPRTSKLFNFALARGGKGGSLGKLGLWKIVCLVFVFCAAAAIVAPAQTLTTLASFDNKNGNEPLGSLVQGTDGNFYGTTTNGGAYGSGTVFKMTPSGTLTTLYSFCAQKNCTDGNAPYAGLMQGTDGNFYGTTVGGGVYNCFSGFGCGTVFKITPSGTLTTLHSFDGTDGLSPESKLAQATDGNFYGTTSGGGANRGDGSGCGTVFKITPDGTLTTLHSFDGDDGSGPYAGLVQATDGNFYGTTISGGAYYTCGYDGSGCGTVFKITPGGDLSTLHIFEGPDGESAFDELLQATDGNLYGTTYGGGVNKWYGNTGAGTIFKMTLAGTLTTLYNFCAQKSCTDGVGPRALMQAADGNFYGTAHGGAYGYGMVYKITPRGTLTTLHSLDITDGLDSAGGLVQAANGKFYGATEDGGRYSAGSVFSLSVGPRIAAASNLDGRLEVFARGTDNAVWHTSQAVAGGSTWNQWTSLGGVVTSDPIVGQNADGRLEVFVLGQDSALWHRSQTAASDSTWTPWSSVGGKLTSNSAVGRNTDGRLEVFARGTDNAIWYTSQTAAGGPNWNIWTSMREVAHSDASVGQNADGRLEVFVLGADLAIWHSFQTTASGSTWSSWSTLHGKLTSDITVGRNTDGRLEVFGRGTDNAIWHKSQTSAGGPDWNVWSSLGGVVPSDPIVAQNADGRLEVFVLGEDSAVWHRSQTMPSDNSWNPWSSLGGRLTSDIAVGRNSDGRLEVFTRGTDNALWHTSQTAAGGSSWNEWQSLRGVLESDLLGEATQ